MRRASIVLALACALPGLPARAGPLDPPAMVVTGRGPTVASFSLREEVEVDYLKATSTFNGAYGGVLIETGQGAFRGGTLWLPALDQYVVPSTAANPRPPFVLGYSPRVLAPGSYRVYLLADRDAEVRLPLRTGDTPLRVRTTRSVRQVAATKRKEFESGQTSITVRKGVTIGKNAFLVLIGQHSGWLTKKLDLRVCLARRSKLCNPEYDPDGVIQGDRDYGVHEIQFTRDDIKPGSRDVLLTAVVSSTVKASVAYGYVEVDRL